MASLPPSLGPDKLRELARAVHEVTVPLRPPGPGLRRRWFQAPSYTDLILDFSGEELARIELTIAGYWLAVEGQHLGTGRTDELSLQGERPVSKLITPDLVRSDPLIAAARTFCENFPEPALREILLAPLPAAR